MRYYSTNKHAPTVSLRDAVMNGLAPDGGLYFPESIAQMSADFYQRLPSLSFQNIAYEVGTVLFDGAAPDAVLRRITTESFDFPVPIVNIHDNTHVLELFHGPTLAFKDFAARFMARLMAHYVGDSDTELTVLVATSGDTGSAVAHGFYNVPGIRVFILYPSKRVSDLQEKQLTTMGGNITALEIDGSFDDCQALVKQAFVDRDLLKKYTLGSANSINIARLFPQTFYYFWTVGQLDSYVHGNDNRNIVISVPSGNVGNLTAGLIAKKMGLPVHRFIAATNTNSVVPEYLQTGVYTPRFSKATISNAMDVGAPSNFVRMVELYNHSAEEMRRDVAGHSVSEEETKNTIREVKKRYNYILDPHGAVGYRALEWYRQEHSDKDFIGVCVETAHPAKFKESVEEVIGARVEIPERLAQCAQKEKRSIFLPAHFSTFKDMLLSFVQ